MQAQNTVAMAMTTKVTTIKGFNGNFLVGLVVVMRVTFSFTVFGIERVSNEGMSRTGPKVLQLEQLRDHSQIRRVVGYYSMGRGRGFES